LIRSFAHTQGVGLKSIYDKAVELGNLKTWTASLEVVKLVELFEGKKELTIFAPTDQAFTKLDREIIEELLQDPSNLARTLCYHIVEGKIETQDLPKQAILRTLFGYELIVENMADLKINEARIIQSNIECRNGMIHTIDKVLVVKRPPHTKDLTARFIQRPIYR
jgi:uncharacterized surface protein with fasciclin (FAS1) repeats